MHILGLFVVQSVKRCAGSLAEVVLSARKLSSFPKDKQYAEATPSGTITMTVTRTAVADAYVPGSVWYVDFTPAPPGIDEMHN